MRDTLVAPDSPSAGREADKPTSEGDWSHQVVPHEEPSAGAAASQSPTAEQPDSFRVARYEPEASSRRAPDREDDVGCFIAALSHQTGLSLEEIRKCLWATGSMVRH